MRCDRGSNRVPADTARRAFEEDGFLVLRGVFRPAEVARFAEAFERLVDRARRLESTSTVDGALFVVDRTAGAADVRVHRVVWCGAVESDLERCGADPRLVDLAARLLGSAHVIQLLNQAHFKLPGDGVTFPWHQDCRHRRYGTPEWRDVDGRGSYVQTVLAIDPMDPHNGGLEIVPRSAGLGQVDDPDRAASTGLAGSAPLSVSLDPGDVLVFGPFLLHRSGPNRSDRPRRILINGYARPGANGRVYPGCGLGIARCASRQEDSRCPSRSTKRR